MLRFVISARDDASKVLKGFRGELDRAGADAEKAADRGHRAWSKFGGIMKSGLLAGAVAGVAALTAVVHTGIGETLDASAGHAQLVAGIKSTGSAAGVTAKHIEDLAGTIQGYSGQTDDSIVATGKLLLTFTNIKNSGPNKIFDEATIAAADMAAKMGGEASASAIRLGKALNDPVKGITALQRVGVSFTEGQKKQIAAMVESGDVAGAQKMILAELNREFGGAAKAAGESLPGQLAKGKRAFEDMSQSVVTAFVPVVVPAIEAAAAALQRAAPHIEAFAQGLAKSAQNGALGAIFSAIGTAIGFVARNIEYVVPILAGLIAGMVAFQISNAITAVTAWSAASGVSALGAAVAFATAPLTLIVVGIAAFVAGLVLLYQKNETFRELVNTVWSFVKEKVGEVVGWVVEKLKEFGAWLKDVWERNEKLRDKVASAWSAVWEAVKKAATWAIGKLKDFGGWLKDVWTRSEKLRDIVGKAFGLVYSGIKLNIGLTVTVIKTIIEVFRKTWEAGGKVKDKLVDAFQSLHSRAKDIWGKIGDVVGAAKDRIVDLVNNIISAINWVIQKVPGVSEKQGVLPTFRTSANSKASNGGTGGPAPSRSSVASSLIPSDGGLGLMDNGGTGVPGQGGMGGGSGASIGGIVDWAKEMMGKLRIPWPQKFGGLFGGASGLILEMAKDAALALIRKYGGGPGRAAVEWAKTQIGKPYLWGATGPDAYDCSGLIYRAYATVGHPFPTRANWWNYGRLVSGSQVRPGDVGFFAPHNSQGVKYGHVKMYAGGGQAIESASGGVHMSPWGGASEIRTYLAKGGIVSGPKSGFPVMMHGAEAVTVTPLDKAAPSVYEDNSRLTINLPPSLTPSQAKAIASREIAAWEARRKSAARAAGFGSVRG